MRLSRQIAWPASALLSLSCCAPRPDAPGTARLSLAPGTSSQAFSRVLQERPIALPEDHGPHPDFQTEWWYYTGNLRDETGARFGYQLTFFRRGLTPGTLPQGDDLSSNQIYFAHLALTDVSAGRHRFAERFSRGVPGLAGARGRPFAVWLEDWRVSATNEDGSSVFLRAADGELSLELSLDAGKPLVAHGYRGVSAKSAEPGNASFYLSYTHLNTRGVLRLAGRSHEVEGLSWFDHEWGTSSLGAEAVGWDWFSLQLDDGRELMFFQIRREDGSLDLQSSGTLVEPDGTTRRLRLSDVDFAVAGRWQSPYSEAIYPSHWFLAVPSAQIELEVRPWLEDQELRTSFTYWEGAVRLEGTSNGLPVGGGGYVEMTGYARSMQGVF